MKMGLLKNFLYYFNLRQGTILIAVVQLFMCGFIMVFFALEMGHAMGIQEMVVRDTVDALEREALEDIYSNHLDTKKMDIADHNATEKVFCMFCRLTLAVTHFISTIMLLYGALTNNRCVMRPWMMMMITMISMLIISLFPVEKDCPCIPILGGKADICDRVIVLFAIFMMSYIWFVVYSTYKSMETKKGLIHAVCTVKKKQAAPVPVETSKTSKVLPNKPFEV